MHALRQWRRHPQVINGMKLTTLLRVLARNGFQVDTQCLGRLAYLFIAGVLNHVYAACEYVFNVREIQATEIQEPPIFVLGHWRSGTTHLHNLLSCDERFCCPSAYQASVPHHFLFTQVASKVFDYVAPTTRPMDNVAFGSSVPHEDEFALAALTGASPYMAVLFPVTGDPGHADPDLTRLPPETLAAWKAELIWFLKKVTLSEGKRLLLKSPPHTGRVATLLDLFPDARFVHIVRDPYVVYRSTWKLWQDSFAHAHLQIPSQNLLQERILTWYTRLFELFERDRVSIPEGSLYELQFEDLEARPGQKLKELYESLGLGGYDRFEPRVARYLESISDYRKNTYRQLDEAARQLVAERWAFTFERYGYRR